MDFVNPMTIRFYDDIGLKPRPLDDLYRALMMADIELDKLDYEEQNRLIRLAERLNIMAEEVSGKRKG